MALNKEEGVDFVIGVRQQSSPVIATQDSLSSPTSTSAQKFNGGCQNDFLLEFPLLLARDDGVIFATQLYVTYSSPKDLTNNYSDGVPRV